jgi:hypothetical protein
MHVGISKGAGGFEGIVVSAEIEVVETVHLSSMFAARKIQERLGAS